MEPLPHQQPQQSPPIRRPIDTVTGATEARAPHEQLKHAALSLKDSSLGYLQAKTELAAIEAKEAATFTKKKISIGIITIFFGFFSYALALIFAHGVILQLGKKYLSKISDIIYINESNIIILLMMLFHLLLFLIYLLKLSKKPEEELFSLTKSEFQKDKQWLAEINENQ